MIIIAITKVMGYQLYTAGILITKHNTGIPRLVLLIGSKQNSTIRNGTVWGKNRMVSNVIGSLEKLQE